MWTEVKRDCVHELGHAIVYNVLYGRLPRSITIRADGSGGYVTYNQDEVRDAVIVAGGIAELIICSSCPLHRVRDDMRQIKGCYGTAWQEALDVLRDNTHILERWEQLMPQDGRRRRVVTNSALQELLSGVRK